MKDNDIPEKSDFYKFGVNIPVPTVRLSNKHPCYGCVWYDKNADVLFCPFHNCVRNKKGFEVPKKKVNENADQTRRYFLRRFRSRSRF